MQYVSLSRLGEGAIDLVLDDGRFRVACALEAWPWLQRSGGRLLLHDFAQRERGARRRA